NRQEHEKIIRPLNVEEDQDRLFKRQRQDDELDEELTSSSPLQDSYMKDPEYFDSLVDNVDLSNIGREEEPMPARLRPSTISDSKAQQKVLILHAHLTILKEYLRNIKLPINEGELMIHIVAPAFRMSIDQNQEKFRKLWYFFKVANQERRRVDQDHNDDCARVVQKTDLIVTLPTGPTLEGFICEVSGGLPAGCPKKIWTDRLKIMVGIRDMINSIMKSFPGLLPEDYMKIVVFGSQVIGLQINLYAMDVRAYGIYRFGIIDKVFLPASMQVLSAYESVHVMLRSLEHRLSNLMEYCSDLKVKHARLRRKRNYLYREDNLAFTNNTPNTSPQKNKRSEIYRL
ncbi:10513_t:CDS:2, partial [Entrophospora sp. SA101]